MVLSLCLLYLSNNLFISHMDEKSCLHTGFFFFFFWFTTSNEILSSGDTKEAALGGKAINVLMPWLGQQVIRAAPWSIHMNHWPQDL